MKRQYRPLNIILGCVLALLIAPLAAEVGMSVTATKHNLSVSGPGPIKVAGQKEVCVFCHTPHASTPIAPLWDRHDPGTYYQTYKSSTLKANVGQPTGTSRLCLSCHDGTVALTQTYNSRNARAATIFISSRDRGYIGSDLSDDHPISFVYDSGLAAAKGEMANPGSLPRALPLDEEGRLQCTTCHDPHINRFGKFLTMDNTESRMCRTCHTIDGWTTSSHATSSASLRGARRDTWDNLGATTVRRAACGACHRPHTAGGRQRLLRHEAEEDNCLSCHDGTVARKNILAEFKKLSRHPIGETTGVHDPLETPRSIRKHAECVDCHDPHRSRSGGPAAAPFVKPAMFGATGASGTGAPVAQATYEYQVCYKCHGARSSAARPLVNRVIPSFSVAGEFAPTSLSYHPVQARGKSSDVPSLRRDLTRASMIYCTDCHNSNARETVRGPHGSNFRPLLTRQYTVTDNTAESPTAYALCYGCHNRASILRDRSFSEHAEHIRDRRAPCSVCHDPHGIGSAHSANRTGSHLINFDRQVVLPSKKAGAGPTFTDGGRRHGSCTLLCHGKDHDNEKY